MLVNVEGEMDDLPKEEPGLGISGMFNWDLYNMFVLLRDFPYQLA